MSFERRTEEEELYYEDVGLSLRLYSVDVSKWPVKEAIKAAIDRVLGETHERPYRQPVLVIKGTTSTSVEEAVEEYKNELKKELSSRWRIIPKTLEYLKEVYRFTIPLAFPFMLPIFYSARDDPQALSVMLVGYLVTCTIGALEMAMNEKMEKEYKLRNIDKLLIRVESEKDK